VLSTLCLQIIDAPEDHCRQTCDRGDLNAFLQRDRKDRTTDDRGRDCSDTGLDIDLRLPTKRIHLSC